MKTPKWGGGKLGLANYVRMPLAVCYYLASIVAGEEHQIKNLKGSRNRGLLYSPVLGLDKLLWEGPTGIGAKEAL